MSGSARILLRIRYVDLFVPLKYFELSMLPLPLECRTELTRHRRIFQLHGNNLSSAICHCKSAKFRRSRTGKKGPYAAYYVHMQPGSCFVGKP